MTIPPAEAETMGTEGLAALRRGDGSAARAAFQKLVDLGHGAPQVRLLLAEACRLLGDQDGETAALDGVLAIDPQHVPALLMRGDLHGRAGDRRAAISFYQSALASATRVTNLPAALASQLERAAAVVRDAGNEYRSHLEQALAERHVDVSAVGGRFEEALEILFGRKQIYLQEPSVFYFPGLPQAQFYDPDQFGWAADLEASTGEIQHELMQLLDEGAQFEPYVTQEKNRPFKDFHGMHGDPSWSAFYLWQNGALVAENAARCPRTVAALEALPMTHMGVRTPNVLFSLLQPNAHIPPHHGLINTRLICHLPLIVPPGCWLRVGNETRFWETGKLIAFDDTVEHEAKNPTDQLRVVLLFDVWKPELDEAERHAVASIFEAIDAFGGVPEVA